MPKISVLDFTFSIIALGFLIYNFFNLEKLGIPLSCPRVLVKLGLFSLFFTVGIYFWVTI